MVHQRWSYCWIVFGWRRLTTAHLPPVTWCLCLSLLLQSGFVTCQILGPACKLPEVRLRASRREVKVLHYSCLQWSKHSTISPEPQTSCHNAIFSLYLTCAYTVLLCALPFSSVLLVFSAAGFFSCSSFFPTYRLFLSVVPSAQLDLCAQLMQ